MQYVRDITEKINHLLFNNKVIILYGARQVGKTTLSQTIIKPYGIKGKYINCELPQYRKILQNHDVEHFKLITKDLKILVLDEAQTIENIGLFLKIITDTYPELQIIATGSSSFNLANKVNEPLTGRSIRFMLYPLSMSEIATKFDSASLIEKTPSMMQYGLYPEVFNHNSELAQINLSSIASNYLYKDILSYEEIKKPKLLENLLILLALQLGNEVSYNEIAKNLNTSSHTIERYIDLLEKIFVIYRLHSFSRNLRKEISKSFKVYFYDLGIRNFIINNFNDMNLRNDTWHLWENFCINEIIKHRNNNLSFPNIYFWRTYDQKEIDFIEEKDGMLYAYEMKWGNKKVKPPKEFISNYPNSKFYLLNRDNFLEILNKT